MEKDKDGYKLKGSTKRNMPLLNLPNSSIIIKLSAKINNNNPFLQLDVIHTVIPSAD